MRKDMKTPSYDPDITIKVDTGTWKTRFHDWCVRLIFDTMIPQNQLTTRPTCAMLTFTFGEMVGRIANATSVSKIDAAFDMMTQMVNEAIKMDDEFDKEFASQILYGLSTWRAEFKEICFNALKLNGIPTK